MADLIAIHQYQNCSGILSGNDRCHQKGIECGGGTATAGSDKTMITSSAGVKPRNGRYMVAIRMEWWFS